MERRVALLNIAHFKDRLKEAKDEAERLRLTALLREEEAKLQAIMEERREDGQTG